MHIISLLLLFLHRVGCVKEELVVCVQVIRTLIVRKTSTNTPFPPLQILPNAWGDGGEAVNIPD